MECTRGLEEVIVLPHKGKWDKVSVKKDRGISLLSMVGKVYRRIIIGWKKDHRWIRGWGIIVGSSTIPAASPITVQLLYNPLQTPPTPCFVLKEHIKTSFIRIKYHLLELLLLVYVLINQECAITLFLNYFRLCLLGCRVSKVGWVVGYACDDAALIEENDGGEC